MKFSYMPIPAKKPVPSLGGALVRYRPVVAVRLTGPGSSKLRDGLLDSGADDTVFPEDLADQLGICLQFFNVDFRGDAKEVILVANASFAGKHL